MLEEFDNWRNNSKSARFRSYVSKKDWINIIIRFLIFIHMSYSGLYSIIRANLFLLHVLRKFE